MLRICNIYDELKNPKTVETYKQHFIKRASELNYKKKDQTPSQKKSQKIKTRGHAKKVGIRR